MADPDLFAQEIEAAARELQQARHAWRGRQVEAVNVDSFPSREQAIAAVARLSAALYPRRLGNFRGGADDEEAFVVGALKSGLALLHDLVKDELGYWQAESDVPFEADQAELIVRHFALALRDVRALIDSDVEAAFVSDPAAQSIDEVLVCYPGAIAVLHHRLANALYRLGAPIVARIISELANERTGIDIHPGATIGPSFFIDHGTGVVIGETAIVGARVKVYQHVTLGARAPLGLSPASPRQRYARHPIVEDDVIIYAGATILGRVTIGRGSIIGGNVWLLSDVPAESVVLQPQAALLPRALASETREVLA